EILAHPGGDGREDDVRAGAVEAGGREHDAGPLLERDEVGEREGDDHDVPGLKARHTRRRQDCPRTKPTAPTPSGAPGPPGRGPGAVRSPDQPTEDPRDDRPAIIRGRGAVTPFGSVSA